MADILLPQHGGEFLVLQKKHKSLWELPLLEVKGLRDEEGVQHGFFLEEGFAQALEITLFALFEQQLPLNQLSIIMHHYTRILQLLSLFMSVGLVFDSLLQDSVGKSDQLSFLFVQNHLFDDLVFKGEHRVSLGLVTQFDYLHTLPQGKQSLLVRA